MKSNYYYYLMITILFISSSNVTLSQSDSCSSEFNLHGIFPFKSSPICQHVWNSQDFILRYLQSEPHIWSFLLSAPNTDSYIAIGFSPTGKMVGSSAIVGWVPDNGIGIVKQYFLGSLDPDQVIPDKGDLQLVNNSAAIVSQSARLYIGFTLNTTLPQSRLIYSVGVMNMLPSANSVLSHHRDQTVTVLDYVAGHSFSQSSYSRVKKSHGILNMLGWGIFMIIGAITARYFRPWDPIWFYSHICIQLFAFFLGVSGVIAGFVLENDLDMEVDKHKALGIFILVLGCLQVMAFLARPEKTSKTRQYWNLYHYVVGRSLIVLSIANIFYGIHLGGEGRAWKAGYAISITILFLVAIILEVRMKMRK
ncbi:hypothetical protein GIB67_011087 [Kingdonia uniflora]|uniref:Cytochrome b561 and DOMON domain-containing protein n=1 Tax=Kingdonia uniflora TaxID=39325 RepID=A0A7J7LKS6_9MAGN|nr:hypothetical protein GIB67_011087 [Kingdonia uniflora]